MERTFIEIVNPRKSNIFVGVIYRHPSMDLIDFNFNYLKKTIREYLKNKNLFFYLEILMLSYNDHNQTNTFLDSLASCFFLFLICC